jgi:hypothetical protein
LIHDVNYLRQRNEKLLKQAFGDYIVVAGKENFRPLQPTCPTTMSFNPNIHHRKSIRLKGYDYSQAGLYFITICVHDRKCLFGKIENDEMVLNDFGKIADEC